MEEKEQQKKYVAPKISSAPYSAGETQREKGERKLAQQKRRVKSSEMMQALRDEFSAAPESADSSGGHANGAQYCYKKTIESKKNHCDCDKYLTQNPQLR